MTEELKRRYIYEKDYDFIVNWAEMHNIQTPNFKSNFPFSLHQFLEDCKQCSKKLENLKS